MFRAALLSLVIAGCGVSNDDRPVTLRYVTEAILSPTCGEAQCHSTFKQSLGDVFDTVEGSRQSLHRNGLAVTSDKADPANASLIHWVTDDQPFGMKDPQGNIIGRMPWDAPMPNADVDLLKRWIGAGVPGAQCVPEDFGGQDCDGNTLVDCDSEGNYSTTVMACSGATPTCVCDFGSNTCGCKAL